MSMTRKTIALWLIRLVLLIAAIICLVEAGRYFNTGMPYVAETSSSPQPSETAKIMGPRLMNSAQLYFYLGIAGIVLVAATFFIKKKRQ